MCTWENRGRENRKKGSPEAVFGHASLVGWEAGFSVDTSLLVGGGGGDFNAQGLVRNTCKTNVRVLQLYISFQTPMDSPRYWRMWYHFFSRAATAVAVENKEWLEDKVLCFPPPPLFPVGTIKEAFFSPSSLRPRETSIDSLEYSEEEIH